VCLVTPDLTGCAAFTYTSNYITIRQNEDPASIDFYISTNPASSACQFSEEQVVWGLASVEKVAASENNLDKIQGGNNWNAGVASLNKVSDYGYLQLIATETGTSRMIGLSDTSLNSNYNTIQYAFFLRGNATLYIYESGSNVFTVGSYSTGDTLRIHIKEGIVHYYQNGELKYLSSNTPSLPMVVDASLYHQGATLGDIMVSNYTIGEFSAYATNAGTNPGYQWQLNGVNVGSNSPFYSNTALNDSDSIICILTPDLGGCSSVNYTSNISVVRQNNSPASIDFYISTDPVASACQFSEEEVMWNLSSIENLAANENDLEKIQGGNSWNGGASSLNIVSDYGYLQFIATETNRSRVVGLSDTDTDSGLSSVDFGLFLRDNGYLYVYENGNNRNTIGTYSTNDTLKIHV
ncbi:MAG: hypothetical protein ACP5E3_00590, partial [Bacteroidales bacterium]